MQAVKIILLFALSGWLRLGAQTPLFNVDFENGLPTGWTQQPAGSWTLNGVFGQPGNCVITEEVGSFTAAPAWISPTLNLGAYTNYSVSFKVAVTKNNFMNPEFTLGYTTGATTQSLAVWAEWFSPTATYTITGDQNYTYPLEAQNVTWQICTHTISSINAGAGSFVFRGDIINGGWVLLDSLLVKGVPTITVNTGLSDLSTPESGPVLFPNPASGTTYIKARQQDLVTVRDISGKQLCIFPGVSNGQTELDLQGFARGIYLVEILYADRSKSNHKLVVD